MKLSLSSLMFLLGTTATMVSGKVCNIFFVGVSSVQGKATFGSGLLHKAWIASTSCIHKSTC